MITYDNDNFVGTEPLFCALHFMEATWLLGPGTKVSKVGHAIPSTLPYHGSTPTLNLICMWPDHPLKFLRYVA